MKNILKMSASLPLRQWTDTNVVLRHLRAVRVAPRVRSHTVVLLFYTLLSIALSWPTARYFTSRLVSDGGDAKHNLWILWHTKEWVLGHQPLFDSSLLYYPKGVSLLTHGLGPVTGFFALPFWWLGPEAAHNGAVLVSLVLTGYCMYLLARGIGLEQGPALFAGFMLLTSPMCLAGLYGLMTRVFLGGLPLVLLAVHFTLDLRRRWWWAIFAALALLLVLMHNGYQFVFISLSVAFFVLAAFVVAKREEYKLLFIRCLVLAAACTIIVGPLLFMIVQAGNNPEITVETTSAASLYWQPDLLHLFVAPRFSRLFKPIIESSAETQIMLSWAGLVLCGFALLLRQYPVRRWFLFTVCCVVLSLGPELKAFGLREFGPSDIVIPLPYTLLKFLPGTGFIRFPTRFMMIGFVGFALVASFGLSWITQRLSQKQSHLVIAGVMLLVLIPVFPQPWPHEELPPTPTFYQQIAAADEMYGVFDFPTSVTSEGGPPRYSSYIELSAFYQMYQMTHKKGIASGYLSRSYAAHPLFAPPHHPHLLEAQPDVFMNRQQALPYTNFRYNLLTNNYRYIVRHKFDYTRGRYADTMWGYAVADEIIAYAFPGEKPIVDDELTTVYVVTPDEQTELFPNVYLEKNWHAYEKPWRWAQSPAVLMVETSTAQPALLQLDMVYMYDPQTDNGLGKHGVLTVRDATGKTQSIPVTANQRVTIPLDLVAGRQEISLSLEAGNFSPAFDYGTSDPRTLSFAISALHLWMPEEVSLAANSDVLVNAQQQSVTDDVVSFLGEGWYDSEAAAGRWAQSPADVWLYSPRAQQLALEVVPVLFYDPEDEAYLSTSGTLAIAVNDGAAVSQTVQGQQRSTFNIAVEAGWNKLVLSSPAGSFVPQEAIPGSGDTRQLSFSIAQLNIVSDK